MRKYCPIERLRLLALLSILVTGCQQADQLLPFELSDDDGATLSLGPSGGTLTFPPTFSIRFPANSLPGSVNLEVTKLIDAPFPQDAGFAVPGSAFDVSPRTVLSAPARVEIAVDQQLLKAGDDVRLSLAVLRADGSVATFGGTYDLTNGLLVANVDELGPMAAVVSVDALSISSGLPPTLGGGAFPAVSAPPPSQSGPMLSSHGGQQFTASCSPAVRKCFRSGIIRLWADDVVVQRLGQDLFFLNPTVEVDFDFIDFDPITGIPIAMVGSASIDGDLRARLNSAVSSYDIDDAITTGLGLSPTATGVRVTGSVMVIEESLTSSREQKFDEEVEFAITGIGTSEMLVISLEAEVDFENDDGSMETGFVTAHVRLRR